MRFNTTIATFIAITLATALPGPQEPSAWLLAEATCDIAACIADLGDAGIDCAAAVASGDRIDLLQCAWSSGRALLRISGCKGCSPLEILDVDDARSNDSENGDAESGDVEGADEDEKDVDGKDVDEKGADKETERDGPPVALVCGKIFAGIDNACPKFGSTFADCRSSICPGQLGGLAFKECEAFCAEACGCLPQS